MKARMVEKVTDGGSADSHTVRRAVKPYDKPSVESEQMFETAALACGKCVSGPFPQFACGSLPYPGS